MQNAEIERLKSELENQTKLYLELLESKMKVSFLNIEFKFILFDKYMNIFQRNQTKSN